MSRKLTRKESNGGMKMNDAEKKLVEALRSGKYNQSRYGLRRPDGFCCLGVACDISGLGVWKEFFYAVDEENTSIDARSAVLPHAVREQLNWYSQVGMLRFRYRFIDYIGKEPVGELSELNDSGEFTFDMIADIIEAGLVLKEGESVKNI